MPEKEYEYRVNVVFPSGESAALEPHRNPEYVGGVYRETKKNAEKGQIVELQQRPLGKWETIERETKL